MKAPPAALLGYYGASGYRTYMNCYGLKFDLVSQDIMLKVVLGADCFIDQPLPPLPRGPNFMPGSIDLTARLPRRSTVMC